MDIGCAVGRSSFELTQGFDEVVGMDYSHSFVNTCNQLKQDRSMDYEMTTVGDLTQKLKAVVNPSLVSIFKVYFKTFNSLIENI